MRRRLRPAGYQEFPSTTVTRLVLNGACIRHSEESRSSALHRSVEHQCARRAAEQPALADIAPRVAESRPLRFRLDSFGHTTCAQRMRECGEASDDPRPGFSLHLFGEAAVELEFGDRRVDQPVEPVLPGTEIVERKPETG